MNSGLIGVLVSVFSALSFSISAIFYKKGEIGLNSLESNALRCIIPLIAFVSLAVYLDGPAFFIVDLHVLVYILIATVIALIIGDTLYLQSIKIGGVSAAVPVACTYPIFTSIIAFFFLGERVSSLIFVGVILTVVGIVLLNHKNRRNSNLKLRRALMFALSAAILWALGISIFRYILFEIDSFHLIVWRTIILTLILSPIALKSFGKASPRNIFYLNIGGFFGIAFGGLLLYYGLASIGAIRAVTISSVNPLFSTALAVALLRERLTSIQALGIVSITVGLIAVSCF
jgi:drug/metabolite transporter (DMT)-like permease